VAKALYLSGSPYAPYTPQSCGERLIAAVRPALGAFPRCAWTAWSTGMPIRLVVADDHPLILDALQQLFSLEPDFQLLACCRNGTETLQAMKDYQPDVLILDVRMLARMAWQCSGRCARSTALLGSSC